MLTATQGRLFSSGFKRKLILPFRLHYLKNNHFQFYERKIKSTNACDPRLSMELTPSESFGVEEKNVVQYNTQMDSITLKSCICFNCDWQTIYNQTSRVKHSSFHSESCVYVAAFPGVYGHNTGFSFQQNRNFSWLSWSWFKGKEAATGTKWKCQNCNQENDVSKHIICQSCSAMKADSASQVNDEAKANNSVSDGSNISHPALHQTVGSNTVSTEENISVNAKETDAPIDTTDIFPDQVSTHGGNGIQHNASPTSMPVEESNNASANACRLDEGSRSDQEVCVRRIGIPVHQFPNINFEELLIAKEGIGATVYFSKKIPNDIKEGFPPPDHHIFVEGSKQSIDMAVKEIEAVLRDPYEELVRQRESNCILFENEKALSKWLEKTAAPNQATAQLWVPDEIADSFIGNNRRKFWDKNRVKVQVLGRSETNSVSGQRCLNLSGKSEQAVAEVKASIEDLIQRKQASTDSIEALKRRIQEARATSMSALDSQSTKTIEVLAVSRVMNDRAAGFDDMKTSTLMTVPKALVNRVVGSGGSTIKRLEEFSGTSVSIPEEVDQVDSDMKTISITGPTQECLEKCRLKIHHILHDHLDESAAGSTFSVEFVIVSKEQESHLLNSQSGSVISKLKAGLQVLISNTNNTGSSPSTRTFKITGFGDGPAQARHEIEQFLKRLTPLKEASLPAESSKPPPGTEKRKIDDQDEEIWTRIEMPVHQLQGIDLEELLIGNNGRCIDHIQQTTGAKVTIKNNSSDTEEDLHPPQRFVFVQGSEHAVKRAAQKIKDIFRNPRGESTRQQLLWKKEIVPIQKAAGKGRDAEIQVLMLIPRAASGCITGQAGTNINRYWAESQVMVKLGNNDNKMHAERKVFLTGTSEQAVAQVKADIEMRIQTDMVQVPTEIVPCIMGHGGAALMKITEKTGAFLKLDKNKDDPSITNITIYGPDQNCRDRSRREMDALLSQLSAEQMQVPGNFIGYLIGPKGFNIWRIERKTGAKIIVLKEPNQDDFSSKTLSISGPNKECTENCRREVNTYLDKFRKRGTVNGVTAQQISVSKQQSRAKSPDSKFRDKQNVQPEQTRLLIPRDKVGYVVGKQQFFISKLESDLKVRIDHWPDDKDGMEIFSIVGARRNQARDALEQRAKEKNNESSTKKVQKTKRDEPVLTAEEEALLYLQNVFCKWSPNRVRSTKEEPAHTALPGGVQFQWACVKCGCSTVNLEGRCTQCNAPKFWQCPDCNSKNLVKSRDHPQKCPQPSCSSAARVSMYM